MKVLVATPCGGGVVHTQYLLSFLETSRVAENHKKEVYRKVVSQIPNFSEANPEHVQTLQQALWQHTIDIGLYTLGGESLLARGRNHCAQVALTQGYDKLFFIDADEGWVWNDFHALVTSPHPITAGLVPLKTYPQFPHNFKTSLNYLPFLDDEVFFEGSLRTWEATARMVDHHKSNYLDVAFTGTGFLCIDVSVLQKLAETEREYLYPNPVSGECETHWDFFGGGPMEEQYLSEDWSLCDKARKLGYKIMVDTNVKITHVGPHQFRVG